MTSMQIAEITGKRHCEVLRAIRNMEPAWEKITLRKFASCMKIKELANGVKMETPYYELTKTECLYVATKFNDEARAKLILRWEQLENERLTALSQPREDEVLPPPIAENQAVTPQLVEHVDGRLVTTSRKLAQTLGRVHGNVLETIKHNLHRRSFKYGNFTRRSYSEGCAHGYEFLITRRGLEALAPLMRRNADTRIAEIYAGAWDGDPKALPVQTTLQLPTPTQPVEDVEAEESTEDKISELAKWVDCLRNELRKAKATARTYAEMYEMEKRRRKYADKKAGYLSDLYADLQLRFIDIDDPSVNERIEAHQDFRKRISGDMDATLN